MGERVINLCHDLKRAIAASASEDVLLRGISKLRKHVKSIADLVASGVGKVVRSLKKHPSKAVSAEATKLVQEWKAMVSSEEQKQPPPLPKVSKKRRQSKYSDAVSAVGGGGGGGGGDTIRDDDDTSHDPVWGVDGDMHSGDADLVRRLFLREGGLSEGGKQLRPCPSPRIVSRGSALPWAPRVGQRPEAGAHRRR